MLSRRCITLGLIVLAIRLGESESTQDNTSEDDPSKRILIEDNYYTIISRLDALTKDMETMKATCGNFHLFLNTLREHIKQCNNE